MPEDFGANEWLVEEMYDQFQADPSSVDPTWVDYFKAHGNGDRQRLGNGSPSTAPPTARRRSRPRPSPRPKPAEKPDARAEAAAGRDHRSAPHVDPTPTPAPVAKPRPATKAAEPAKGTTNPVPKEQPPAEQADASDEPTYTVLRGAPARTAQNMDASLTVPTATSVRSVPVKLLWDNRTSSTTTSPAPAAARSPSPT